MEPFYSALNTTLTLNFSFFRLADLHQDEKVVILIHALRFVELILWLVSVSLLTLILTDGKLKKFTLFIVLYLSYNQITFNAIKVLYEKYR